MVYRIDVRTRPEHPDAQETAIRAQIHQMGMDAGSIGVSRVFFIDTPASIDQAHRIANELLADPVTEEARIINQSHDDKGSRIEVHFKPGVMDPVAASTEMAIRDMGIDVTEIRTGRAYTFSTRFTRDQLQTIARQALANAVVESVYFETFLPHDFAHAREHDFQLRHVPIRNLTDDQLQTLSRQGH